MPARELYRTQSRAAFLVGLLALVVVVFGLVTYSLWRLRAVAIDNQLGSAAQYANAFEEHLTQTLSVIDVNLVNLAEQPITRETLQTTIRNARYLRSISVVNSTGSIEESSEPRNVGIAFKADAFLPESAAPLPVLRAGPLTSGRDLYDARAIAKGSEVPKQSFIAVQRDVPQENGGFIKLVAVINPDYFLNYYGRNLDLDTVDVELLRLDGGLLLSTAQTYFPGSTGNTLVMDMVTKAESGRARDDLQSARARLTAYRVSKYFPFVAVVHLDLAKSLGSWRAEAQSTSITVAVVLALTLAMAVYYFLRMRRLAEDRKAMDRELDNQKYALDEHAIVSITDASGAITYANDRFCTISGYSREELIGQQHRIVKSAHHPAHFYETLWHTISQGQVWHGEICNRRKNGDLYWVSASIVPLLGADGMVQQYIGIRTDISQRKQIESSLEIAKSAAEQANVAKSQFLANMSHEIRTPMNAILGMLQLLQRTSLSLEQRDYAGKTEGAARSLLGLLNDILDFSKVEAGKMELDHRPFRLDRMLRDVSVILASNLGDKPVRLTMDVAPDVPLGLLGDDMRLAQILVNLGGNSIKFTDQGEVKLQVRRLASDAGRVTLEFLVSDTGIGIAPEHREHIFDGFSQAESSTTRRFGGTGLGLAICQQLVHLMGGQLQLSSTLGEGSTFFFHVSLPLAEVAAPPSAPATVPAGTKAKRLLGVRLLVVEDNKINQMVAQGLLSQEGAIVTLADNGRLGVDALMTAEPVFDAVLMDLQMPVMDGFEATRAIRAVGRLSQVPIIAMTANAMASDREACLAAGMNDHVGKPFELDHLVAILHSHTGGHLGAQDPQLPAAHVATAADNATHDHPPGDLDVQGALNRVGGDTGMYATVLGAFAREMQRAPDQVQAHLQAQEPAEAVRALHTLKGLAATVGARHLASVAARLEQKVRNSDALIQDHQAQFAELRSAMDALTLALVPVLQQYQEAQSAAPACEEAVPLDQQQFALDVDALLTLLRDSNMAALQAYALIKRRYSSQVPDLAPMDAAMGTLDFATAQDLCAALLVSAVPLP